MNHQIFTIEPFNFDIIKRISKRSFLVESTLEDSPIYGKKYIMKILHMDNENDKELNELLVYRCLKYHEFLCPLKLYFMYIIIIFRSHPTSDLIRIFNEKNSYIRENLIFMFFEPKPIV